MKIKQINTPKLRSILDSINPRVVKEVIITPWNCGSGLIEGFDIKIGYSEYRYWVGDIDDRYTLDGVDYFINLLKEYSKVINFNIIPFRYSHKCNYDRVFDNNIIKDYNEY